jgi:hypothetical protein
LAYKIGKTGRRLTQAQMDSETQTGTPGSCLHPSAPLSSLRLSHKGSNMLCVVPELSQLKPTPLARWTVSLSSTKRLLIVAHGSNWILCPTLNQSGWPGHVEQVKARLLSPGDIQKAVTRNSRNRFSAVWTLAWWPGLFPWQIGRPWRAGTVDSAPGPGPSHGTYSVHICGMNGWVEDWMKSNKSLQTFSIKG